MLAKLFIGFAVPTAVLFAVFATLTYRAVEGELEAELGKRLMGVAQVAASNIRDPDYLSQLMAGDEDNVAHRRTVRDLGRVAAATGASRVYVFDAQFTSFANTDQSVALGSKDFLAELDRVEVSGVFGGRTAATSVLFEGRDGKLYKAGYAPVLTENGTRAVLAVGVDAPAEYFDRLKEFRNTLFASGALLLGLVGIAAVWIAARITRPIRQLASAAESIAGGNLERRIEGTSRDEIGFLASTMERMRIELVARDQRAQMMLAGVAHEIRNPLGGLELFSGFLADEIPEEDERRTHVDRIRRETAYLARVVEDFLAYARRPRPQFGDVDVAALVDGVADVARGDASKAGVEIRVDSSAARVHADATQLRRALLNLVTNAVQACERGGRDVVTISVSPLVSPGGVGVEITVHNFGDVIPEEVRGRLFEPFFTAREKGTGLGLAFAREITEDHGGELLVSSDDQAGTTFTIRIPGIK